MTISKLYVDTALFRYRAGYKETNAFLAVPSTPGDLPGIVLAHDVFGLDEHVQDIAVRLAAQGYTVLVPDFYGAKGGPGDTSTFERRRSLRRTTPDEIAVKDVISGYEYLTKSGYSNPNRTAVIGFGLGGTIALLACAKQIRYFAACVNFYGDIIYPRNIINRAKPVSPLEIVPYLNCPMLAFYGAPEEDISRQDVSALETALRTRNKNYELKVYPNVPNGFFNDARPDAYRAQAAVESYQIMTRFLDRYLRS
jgi:carboxymethylenebutenolidase